jgi:hypothetical protein
MEGTAMNFSGIMIGSENPEKLVEYYTDLFGKPGFDDGGYTGWQFGSGWVTVSAHDQVKGKSKHPGRILWNLETPDVKGEFAKLRDAGAIVVQEPYQPGGMPEDGDGREYWVATFADPDDNYFQLVNPM